MGLLDLILNKVKNDITSKAEEMLDSLDIQISDKQPSESNYTANLPDEFKDFPVYPGKAVDGPIESSARQSNTSDYKRLSFFYKGRPNQEYLNTLIANGYTKRSDVHFDKGNTYIIVEYIHSRRLTKIAYHVNL